MNNYDYYIFKHSDDPKTAHIENLLKVSKSYFLKEGIPCKEYVPPECELFIHASGGDLITSIMGNIDNLVLISTPAKTIFEAGGATEEQVEYLPFTLKDKKGNVAADQPYYIANCLRKIECVDFERIKQAAEEDGEEDDPECGLYSGVFYNSSKTVVSDFAYLYLKEDELPEDAIFFRIGECPKYMVIRSDLVEALQNAGMTGLCLKEMGDLA